MLYISCLKLSNEAVGLVMYSIGMVYIDVALYIPYMLRSMVYVLRSIVVWYICDAERLHVMADAPQEVSQHS